MDDSNTNLAELAKAYSANTAIEEGNALRSAMPLIDRIRKDGASFLFSADGERASNVYTLIISGGPLRNDHIRVETSDLPQGLFKVISEYSNLNWKR